MKIKIIFYFVYFIHDALWTEMQKHTEMPKHADSAPSGMQNLADTFHDNPTHSQHFQHVGLLIARTPPLIMHAATS